MERLDEEVTYQAFLNGFLKPNRPCIIGKWLVKDWSAFERWSGKTPAATTSFPSLDAAFAQLVEEYGDHCVPVVVQHRNGEETHSEKRLDEAIAQMSAAKQRKQSPIYVKDWHLVRQQGNRGELPYTTPGLFADDWMNNTGGNTSSDDFRFCYAGSQGTQTGIHCDVYTSYSWSTNIVGVKRWTLFPPHVQSGLYKPRGREMYAKVQDIPQDSPALRACIVVEQQPAETIFIPSDWYHQVENLSDCISLNHNWCNATNIVSMYDSMCKEVVQTEEALHDVKEMICQRNSSSWQREWTETVQQVVSANAGWAWKGFWEMIHRNVVESPPCDASLRPDSEYIFEQIRQCVDGFLQRKDVEYLPNNVVLLVKQIAAATAAAS